jgi:hypothetical protein
METKSFLKSLDGPTYVHAVRESGFKKCCMRSGKYDGSRRNYFFSAKRNRESGTGRFRVALCVLSRLSELREPILRTRRGWFARPGKANGDAAILLPGVGDNRQGMMGFAELFLSNGFAVLTDSRGGGDFPTYGLESSDQATDSFWRISEVPISASQMPSKSTKYPCTASSGIAFTRFAAARANSFS